MTQATTEGIFERGRRVGRDEAARIVESEGYHGLARTIRSGGDPDQLALILRERNRTVRASTSLMAGAMFAVVRERERQEEKFPGEVLVDGTGDDVARELVEVVKRWCDARDAAGSNSFALVLAEEVFEAFAETDEEAIRREVVEIAAVAIKWLESLDAREIERRHAAGAGGAV